MWRSKGFTVIELLLTITVIVTLAAVAVYPSFEVIPRAQDTERLNDIASISRRLEQAYSAQEVGAPAYPTTTKLLADISAKTGTVARLESDAFKAPGASTSSVVAATSNSKSTPKGANSPVLNEYVYQPLTSSNTLCTGTATCVRFFLYYRTEENNIIKIVKSIHQQ